MKQFSKIDLLRMGILFTLLLLPNICALFMAADLEGSLVMKLGYMGMVVACLLLPALILKARTYFILEGVFNFLWMPIDIGSLYLNKQSASKLFLNSILQTDISEATEILQSIWPIGSIVIIMWALYAYLCTQIPNNHLFNKKVCYWAIGAIISVTLLTYAALTCLIRQINPNLTTAQLLYDSCNKLGMKFFKIYPYNIYINVNQLWQDKRAWYSAQQELRTFSFNIQKRDSLDNALYILYIGEAARYDHFGINQYIRNTTPHLSTIENIISFSSIYTQANLTNYSIPFILTRATADKTHIMYEEKSITEAFQEAGYNTAFISKNSYTPFTMRIMNSCDYHYIFSRGLDAVNSYDIDLVQHLIAHYNNRAQFVVLHALGSHFKYSLRYPAENEYYTPAMAPNDGYSIATEDNKELLINTYDNTIRYTDYVLHQLIQWADTLDQQVIIMYISDHGESLWDDQRKLSLHGSYQLSEAEYHVPCFIWYSDEYALAHPEKISTMISNKHITQNSSITFSTLLDLASIYEVVDSTKSLCSPYLKPNESFPVLNGAGEIKIYSITQN